MKPALIALAILAAAPALAQGGPVRIPLDGERTLNGVAIGCTGVGQAKKDPRWLTFPIQVEFAAPGGDYLADEDLSISDHSGRVLATVACEGPWILLRPDAPGDYSFRGWAPGAPAAAQSGTFHMPAKGHARMVLHFPTR